MKNTIFSIIEEVLQLPNGTITEEMKIEDISGWDSLAHVMIIGQIDEKLGISIPLDEAIEIETVQQLLEKVGA